MSLPGRWRHPSARLLAIALALGVAVLLASAGGIAVAVSARTRGNDVRSVHSGSAHRRKCAPRSRRHGRGKRCRAKRRHSASRAPAPPPPTPGPTLGPSEALSDAVGAQSPVTDAAPGPSTAAAAATPEPEQEPSEQAPPVQPPSVPHVQVSAVEYAFSLSRTTVPAGKVVFEFVNDGQDEHNLNIAPQEGPLAGSFANTPSKGVGDLTLEVKPGTYTLYCSLPQHEQKGMKATLVVE
jgi:plastocyanin